VAVTDPFPAPVQTAAGMVTPLTGKILPGGTVSLNDGTTPVLVAPGAVINVSGAASAFDVEQPAPGASPGNETITLARQPVWSDAGEVDITAGGMLFAGTLIGQGGAPLAAGGTLSISAPVSTGGSVILVADIAQALEDAGASFDFSTFVPEPVSRGSRVPI